MRSHNREQIRAKRLFRILSRAKALAMHGTVFYGTAGGTQLAPYTWQFPLDGRYVNMILTRDEGMHSGGWFKNPDFDRCWHLSLSFRHLDKSPMPFEPNRALVNELLKIMFKPGHIRMMWIEGPFSKIGKELEVWHYRLMCDRFWEPIQPRKEVYTKEFTQRGWKSFSEIHGRKPNMIMTP